MRAVTGDRPNLRFPSTMRLSGRRAFAAVFEAGLKRTAGPLIIYARRNEVTTPRLGLSISRAVGNAVKRNLIKRRLREAFRLAQHNLPPDLDLVIVVRRHDPLPLADYTRLLSSAAAALAESLARG